ncbi:MAG: tetratricopeptide repeat protein [Nitrospinota bacterium]
MRDEGFPTINFDEKYGDEARANPELRKALDLLAGAESAHRGGDIGQAIELYKNSIAYHPTSDAHTYLGWMYSKQGRLEEAIEECHLAIEVDPDFGNPYNDIGCHLMQLGELEQAIGWFEKAKKAPRYEPRHFPYLNLARIYLKRGEHGKAAGEVLGALRRDPGDRALKRRLLNLLALLN